MRSLISAYDILVVGGGHAGCEAAAAAARMGCRTALLTLTQNDIGALSCNPAVGGVGKGQLVKELDALGGLMGEVADRACIQYRRLNTTRGAAVQSTRMQVDMDVYGQEMQRRLAELSNLDIVEDEVLEVRVSQGRVQGLRLAQNGLCTTRAAVLTPGTFFHGLIHIGSTQVPGGRMGNGSSSDLPRTLADLGFRFGRFKTGTTPRLDGRSIDFSLLTAQPGDEAFLPFSRRSPDQPALPQTCCYLTQTSSRTHQIIRDHLHESALYSGQIVGTGVRYCPSVEDKIVKFPERESHHVFVEPEGLHRERYYPNGISNSLPLEVQVEMVRSIRGLEHAEILQSGYGIEHDYLDPTQLTASLESKSVPGLFFAGQINGTTGYEEAAAQGLLAGINAARQVRGEAPVILDRSQATLGVLIDDLVTKGTNEPYRMFTSRVEYRLVLREDNARERLTPLGYSLGLISEIDYRQFQRDEEALQSELQRLRATRVEPSPLAASHLQTLGTTPCQEAVSLEALLRRPQVHYADLAVLDPSTGCVPQRVRDRAEVEVKYAGYIQLQQRDIEKFKHLEEALIPAGFRYDGLSGLSLEVCEKLTRLQPRTLGQASRISGVTPAAISLLLWHLKKS